jgi:hypothetical protein
MRLSAMHILVSTQMQLYLCPIATYHQQKKMHAKKGEKKEKK